MKNTTPISPGTKQQVIEFVKIGNTVAQASDYFAVSRSSIYKILNKAGIEYNSRNILKLEEVESYIRENPNKMLKDYAAQFNVSIPGIHQFLNKHGIQCKSSWSKL